MLGPNFPIEKYYSLLNYTFNSSLFLTIWYQSRSDDAKKNAEITVGTKVESMEEAIGVMQGEIVELKGEFTNRKECLQQILQNQ